MGKPPSPELEARATAVLRERFGLDALRPWQAEAVAAILEGTGRALVVAPTGGGKSLVYQLPAVLVPGGVTLVVSPLISLMEDQVRSLEKRGVAATFLASTLDGDEVRARRDRIRRGEVSLVYVAPERLNDSTMSLVEGRLALLAVDEAHCIVQWGHDFRPDYLRIRDFIDRVRPPRVLACTATATPITRDAIVAALGLEPSETEIIVRGFARPNLALSVVEVEGPRETRLLTSRSLTEALGSRKKPKGAGIVYAGTRKGTERIAEALRKDGFSAHAYHAGMAGEDRTEVANRFASCAIDVVVATNAFGMGIDRPDVRIVVHAQPPASLEAYYQEVGRAGRDGDPAEGILYTSPADIGLRRRLIELDRDGGGGDEGAIARAWALFRELLRYVDARSCRHDFILGYFGDEAETLGGCGKCDVCLARAHAQDDPEKLARDTEIVRKALAGVARAQRRGGMQAIAQMLAGIANEKVKRFGFDDLSTFGILSMLGEKEASGVLRATIAAGYVGLTPTEHPVPFLTVLGGRVMKAESPNEIVLRDAPKKASRRAVGQRARVLDNARERRLGRHDAAGATEDAAEAKAQRRTAEMADMDVDVAKRFEALRTERARLAKEAKVPAYVVAHDRALMALAESAPGDVGEMENVPGWGPSKVAKWGAALLGAMGG
jgi:ATP-dependent DNA helicase RecQ